MFHRKSPSLRGQIGAFLGLALALLCAPPGLGAPVPAENFRTTPVMREETRNLLSYLEYSHYLRLKLDNINANDLITEYLQTLDPKHLYFTEREVEDIRQRYAPEISDQLSKGLLTTAFTLFLDYRLRVMERNQWILHRLGQPFTFDADTSYEPDRSKAPWPLNAAEQTTLWERQLQYELLNEMLPILVPYKDDEEEAAEGVIEHPAKAEGHIKRDVAAKDETSIQVRDEATEQTATRTLTEAEKTVATDSQTEPKTEEEALEEAIATVKKRYQRFVQWVEETEPEEVQEMFLSTLSRLYDPHSVFMSATTMEEFSMAIRNSLVGIGAVLSDMDGYCTIKELLPGGPAERSNKLKPEDQIVGVAQGTDGEMVDVIGMRLRKIVKMIRGSKGSEVRLLIRPANADPAERITVTLTRDEVKLTEQLAQAELYTLPIDEEGEASLKIGVINLPAFYGASQSDGSGGNSTTADVAELIAKLKKDGMQGLVLDLRSNGGGLLGEAINLTGLFLPKSPVVQVRNSRGQVQDFVAQNNEAAWDGPLVVLVSRFSASASEITAGALRDNQRALIIGDESTHGKGTVQAIFDMNRQNFFSMLRSSNRGAAKITVQKYYLPGGDSTQINGVKADIPLPSFNTYLPIGEGDLPNALIHDSIAPVQWDRKATAGSHIVSIDENLIDKLLDASQQRQQTLPEFSYLKRNIDFLRTRQEEKKLSLNLSGRLSQRQKDRVFRDAMEEEFDALRKSNYPFEKILLDAALRQKQEHDTLMAERKQTGSTAAQSAENKVAAQAGTQPELAGQTASHPSSSAKRGDSTTDSSDTQNLAAADAKQKAAQTKAATGEDVTDKATRTKDVTDQDAVAELDEDASPKVDIHLRESLRVMSDWLHHLHSAQAERVAADTAAHKKNDAALSQSQ